MQDYRPDLSPEEVHASLLTSLDTLRRAESRAVLWFAEVLRRRLFVPLGYATMELYAEGELGFSTAKTRQFLRLARQLEDLPAVRDAVADGSLPWTKARTVASAATPETEGAWLQKAEESSSRELEDSVRRSRTAAKAAPTETAPPLLPVAPAPPPEVPVTVSLTLKPVQHARFTRLLERLRKRGRGESREELVLQALAALLDTAAGTRVPAHAPNTVVLYRCEECGEAEVDGRPVAPSTAETVECDALMHDSLRGGPVTSTIPPSVRRTVLARDRHRCSAPGCRATRMLEIHHITPRFQGGTHDPDNLLALCSACHFLAHQKDGLVRFRRSPMTLP